MTTSERREAAVPQLNSGPTSVKSPENFVGENHFITNVLSFQLRPTGRQLTHLSRLISNVGTFRYSKIKAELGLLGVPAADLSRADVSRLIAELRLAARKRGRR